MGKSATAVGASAGQGIMMGAGTGGDWLRLSFVVRVPDRRTGNEAGYLLVWFAILQIGTGGFLQHCRCFGLQRGAGRGCVGWQMRSSWRESSACPIHRAGQRTFFVVGVGDYTRGEGCY